MKDALPITARRRREAPVVLALAGTLLWLTGCNSNEALDKHIERARAAREVNHLPVAIIELRDALQQDPKNLTARLLLAQTAIDMSDGAGGEAQVLRAKQDGAQDLDTIKPLAEADLLEGKYDSVIKLTAEPPTDAPFPLKASLLAFRGTAFAALDQRASAQAAFDAGLKQDPHSLDLLVALTKFALRNEDQSAAQERFAEALAQAPDDPRIATLQGDVAYSAKDFATAELAYQKRLTIQPWNPLARIDVARGEIANDHTKEAIANLDIVLARFPNNPRVNYLRGLASFRDGDYAAAQSFSLAALAVVPDFSRAELIAGAASFGLNQFEQANKYLGPYVHDTPDDLVARKLLASVQVALGHPGEAVATLKPALDKASNDGQLVAMIGLAAARSGDMMTANRYLKQATEQQPDNAALRSELANTQVALGQTDAGIEDFEAAIKSHPQELQPQLQLYLTYMGQKDYDKALQTAQRLQRNLPNDAAGYDMVAVVELAMGNVKDGRAALLKARDLRPGDFNANRNLARLAIAEGKIDEARQYYQDILAVNPTHTPTYVEIATLEDGLGHQQAAEAALRRAVQANPKDPMAHAALAKFELFKGRYQQALDAIRPALDKFPRSPILLEEAGRARLALGQSGDALATFKTLSEVLPNAGWVHLLLAEAFTEEGITNSAIGEANAALNIDPKDEAANLILARELLAARRLDEAQKVLLGLAADHPSDIAVSRLVGLVAQAQGRYDDAAKAFAEAVAIDDNQIDRERLAEAQAAGGHTADAEKTVETWLDTHPQDLTARRLLGDLYLANNRLDAASKEYLILLKSTPKDAAALNNLASALSGLNRPKEALAYARDAVAAAPNSVDNLDTLGTILLQNGVAAEAATDLNTAFQKSPNRPDLQFHLAQALAASGKNSDALDVLRGLLVRNRTFKDRADAEKLLQQLGG